MARAVADGVRPYIGRIFNAPINHSALTVEERFGAAFFFPVATIGYRGRKHSCNADAEAGTGTRGQRNRLIRAVISPR
jgi:hypothetical protein